MRRAILLVTVIIAAMLLGSAAVAFAAPPDKAASKKSGSDKAVTETTAPETTDQAGPITIENHTWGGYHWARQSNPFTVKLLKDRLRTSWDSYLNTTSTDWSADKYGSTDGSTDSNNFGNQDLLNTTVPTASSTRQISRKCPYVGGMVQVCDYTYGNNGWLGVASIYISGSHITQGVVKMNDSYFNTTKYNTPAWRNLVMCQEVGHTLGLDHQDENFSNGNLDTCMDYTNNPESNQHPDAHDYYQLTTIYQHPDSSTTLAQTADTNTRGGDRNGPGNSPNEWGREIWREEHGRASVFEKKLDSEGKKKQLTHVLWTLEQAEKLKGGKPQDEHQEGQQEQTQQEQQDK